MSLYENLTNKFSVSKTLRFELVPQGRTLENMISSGILEEDEHRAESVDKIKVLINNYHKKFIDTTLAAINLQGLDDYYELYINLERSEKEKLQFEVVKKELRNQISTAFKNQPQFKKLFGKELFTEILPAEYKSEEEQLLIDEFRKFTSYFVGFNTTRQYIYTNEPISSSVAYRLIDDNLPIYIQNMFCFESLSLKLEGLEEILQKDFNEFLGSFSVKDFFTLDGFNLVITQKGISLYNLLIGGYSKKDGEKVSGINEYINIYNQTGGKNEHIRLFKPLKKQILSDVEKFSFVLDKFETDDDLVSALNTYWNNVKPLIGLSDLSSDKKSMLQLMHCIRDYDLSAIYVHADFIKTLSQKLFGKWDFINQAMYVWYDNNYLGSKKAGTKSYEQEKEKYFKSCDNFSIEFLNECCKCKEETKEGHVERYFERYCDADSRNFAVLLSELYKEMCSRLPQETDCGLEKKKIVKQKQAIRAVKAFLDSAIDYQHFLKPLSVKADSLDSDAAFYDDFIPMYDVISEITVLYNKVRNYITKKPYSNEKIKLNFSSPTLLSGWSNETVSSSVILKKDGFYYLGIIGKKSKNIFKGDLPSEGETYGLMEYCLLPGPNKSLPKIFFKTKDSLEKYAPSEEVLRIYETGSFKKGDNFSLDDCHKLIDYFKECLMIHPKWSEFNFHFSDTSSYQDISGFYYEVGTQGYSLSFHEISKTYIDKLVDEGKLYLFQIYNKDFSSFSKGTPNLHTMYFKALFEERNLKDVVYKLNGDSAIYYRKKSIEPENAITHPANEHVSNKNPLNPNKTSLFNYTLIKDKRYTVDKFQFHVPITMNFKAKGSGRINADVNQQLCSLDDTYVIGINRGERHLLYITVVDSKGTIVEELSLNEIINEYNGVIHRTDYHALLESKANDREAARKNWDTIENIKELKEGYFSQVIHKITQLMVKYQAIVVIEDFNFGFIKSRQYIEKNVYQKFVEKLLDKLNYYVDKNADPEINGGLYHAYQLAGSYDSLKMLGKQNGVVFFVPAYYISNIDPVTGFVNMLYTKYESVKASKEFFEKFDDIYYDAENDYFCFDTDYSKFTDRSAGTREQWTICSYGNRIHSFRNPEKNMQWDFETVNLTAAFDSLFSRYNIVYDNYSNGSLKEQILAQNSKEFFQEMMEYLSLMLQLRNYDKTNNYIISPVKNADGEFFDSRNAKAGLPSNWESNGAYNIARKGLWMIDRIKNSEEPGKEKLTMSNQEWLNYVQNN